MANNKTETMKACGVRLPKHHTKNMRLELKSSKVFGCISEIIRDALDKRYKSRKG